MNNVFVICETVENKIAEVSFELLTKGRELSDRLNCRLETIALGCDLEGIEDELFKYGADTVYLGNDKRLSPYTTLPYAKIIIDIFRKEKPQIALLGATSQGRDLGPRLSSALSSGLTADCTALKIGDYTDKKIDKTYKDLLYQIRPAFGGNIIATIVNPECRPQMATVREGVMKKCICDKHKKGSIKHIDVSSILNDNDLIVKVIDRHIGKAVPDIKNASVIVAGGYGMGSKENFALLNELASTIGGEVGASRAAVDAGFCENFRQIGQTGVTVRPKLYIACGISGQVQHTAGMSESNTIIAINTDKDAPVNKIADYVITGDAPSVVKKIIRHYRQNSR